MPHTNPYNIAASCCKLFFLIFVCFFLTSNAFAIDNESDRERIVSAKSRKFYKNGNISQSILLSGNRDSDQNSKEYQLDCRYYYRSGKQMHEFYFTHEQNYSNLGTAKNKHHLVKKSELYDAIISDKFMIADSNNYAVFYGRANYDDLSSYYYDYRVAGGVGRIFFDDKVELDASVGYNNIKVYDKYQMFFLPSVRINLQLTKNISLINRGYFFINSNSIDNDFRTTIKYRISKKVSFAINHTYEQRRYKETSQESVSNQIRKYLSFGLVFDLN